MIKVRPGSICRTKVGRYVQSEEGEIFFQEGYYVTVLEDNDFSNEYVKVQNDSYFGLELIYHLDELEVIKY